MEQFLVVLLSLVIFLFIKGIEFFYKKLPIDMNFFYKSLLSIILTLLSLFILLFLITRPFERQYKYHQASARYNSAKANHVNAKNYIMAEISKCNSQTTALSFVASDGTTQMLASACPLSTSATGLADAQNYFRRFLWDKFKNPYATSAGVIKGATTMATAANSAKAISEPGTAADEGYISITAAADSTSSFTLMTNVGQADGFKNYEVLTERIELISQQLRRDQ